MGNKVNCIGERYGRLTVVKEIEPKFAGKRRVRRLRIFECKCDCGNTKNVIMNNLRNGTTKSCGCLMIERTKETNTRHGMSHKRIYNIWDSMVRRCGKLKNYKNVKVCEEWKLFDNFYKWSMENGYKSDLTIDRIDPYGNYEPSNCRWATPKEQSNNKRNNIRYEIDGVFHTASEWADIYDVSYKLLKGRLRRGMDIVDALTNKSFIKKKTFCFETGVTYPSKRECAKALGLNENAICNCISGKTKSYKGYHFKYVED